jgi:hypothetical protein
VLRPEPDFAWWRGSRCLFVGDAKYKQTAEGRLADLYQLLAYCTAARLPEGLLLYAEQTGGPSVHVVRHGGPILRVEAMDLEAPVAAIERRCDEVAAEVRTMAARNVWHHHHSCVAATCLQVSARPPWNDPREFGGAMDRESIAATSDAR